MSNLFKNLYAAFKLSRAESSIAKLLVKAPPCNTCKRIYQMAIATRNAELAVHMHLTCTHQMAILATQMQGILQQKASEIEATQTPQPSAPCGNPNCEDCKTPAAEDTTGYS